MDIASELRCSQCGGELNPEDGQLFINCPYCDSTLFLSKGRIVFHWYLEQVFDQEQAEASLARWLSNEKIGVNLGHNAQLISASFVYFPFWMIRTGDEASDELLLEPAAAIAVTEIKTLQLQGGDFRKFSEEIEERSIEPTIPLSALTNQFEERGIDENHITETALIHLPIYTFKYTYRNREYTALVEGSSGRVFANIHPEKTKVVYLMLSLVTALAFMCLGTFPCIGYSISEELGRSIGFVLCISVGAIFGIVVVAIAGWFAGEG